MSGTNIKKNILENAASSEFSFIEQSRMYFIPDMGVEKLFDNQ